MKNITRLALALALATFASLAPLAHASDDPEAQPTPGGAQAFLLPTNERSYDYYDEDGPGTMTVQDGPKQPWGRPIYVTLYQNGYTFYGQGKRSYASYNSDWLAYCEFWLYGSGSSAKFKGYLPIYSGYSSGGGNYFYNGYGSPHWWEVSF